jgi:pimeloyl-ACP methyl ester carboxylesterase
MRSLLACLVLVSLLWADGPGDNIPDKVRPVPPVGIKLSDKDRADLTARTATLKKTIDELPKALGKGKAALLELLPDVQIFHRAVEGALKHDEFFAPGDIAKANKLLDEGLTRAKLLAEGKPAWTTATGLVVRGYRSRIDDTVQPYGLVVPRGYHPEAAAPFRLDVWLHGRYEKQVELTFIDERMRVPGQFTPPGAFVLHTYGRFSNAFKWAGEVDVLEALAHAQKHYRIDEDRLVMRGFSMGGAGCWQLAGHYPSKWVAAAPGAGFSETPEFLKVFQNEKLTPAWYEQKLWQLYDMPNYALNFHNLPTIAYSGEKDKQKQAADVMARALDGVGLELVHLIGPGTGHSYHPQTRAELNARIDRLAAKGRDRMPGRVRFTTPTLRYRESYWVRLDALQEHWKPATIDASLQGRSLTVQTTNVAAFTLHFGPGEVPAGGITSLFVDRGKVELPSSKPRSDGSWSQSLVRTDKGWAPGNAPPSGKIHGLQGPIDDAFLDRFLIVRPTGTPMHKDTGNWVNAEMERAIREWRRQMRGDALVKDDKDITNEDMKTCNIILWGDPSSNRLLGKILPQLPLKWDTQSLTLAGRTHEANGHMPVLIYPNPLNPARYVVLNSGFTYREYDYLNNARQNAKLPDWAIVDLRVAPNSRWPGKIVDADFFDEQWKVKSRSR